MAAVVITTFVSLLRLAENYFELEKMRLNDEVPIAFEVNMGANAGAGEVVKQGGARIVPLILITFLENAFKHGIGNGSRKNWITVSLNVSGNELEYTVKNTRVEDSEKTVTEQSGIGLLKIMPRRPLVVLTTAYSEYAIEGYELDVADYLLKPITFERFLQSVEKIQARLGSTQGAGLAAPASLTSPAPAAAPTETPDYLFVKNGTKSVRINFADIQHIEGMKDYVRIHLPDRKVTTLQNLKHLVEVLPADDFLRVHHSYIVGTNWIEEVQRDDVLVAGTLVPVSDTYRGGVKAFVQERELK